MRSGQTALSFLARRRLSPAPVQAQPTLHLQSTQAAASSSHPRPQDNPSHITQTKATQRDGHLETSDRRLGPAPRTWASQPSPGDSATLEVARVERPSSSPRTEMDPNQPWNWQPPPGGGNAAPMPNWCDPVSMQFTQQPHPQNEGRNRRPGAYQTSRERRRQRRERLRTASPQGVGDQAQGSAPHPGPFLPLFPMVSAAQGAFSFTPGFLPQYRYPLSAPTDPAAMPFFPPTMLPFQMPGLNAINPGAGAGVPAATNKNAARPPPASPFTANDDAIQPPSAASGGVPDPTPAYLLRSSLQPLKAPSPRPILVVLDLNGTLLHRPSKRTPSKFVERPQARDFLRACIDRHRVVIWSSARPENVSRMCAQLLPPEYLSRVLAVWGRDRFGLSAADYTRRTQCYKRLTRLWADETVAASHPDAAGQGGSGGSGGGCWNQGNTALIDDSAEKARSEPHNAITLPEFVGDVDEDPPVLARVLEYLETLSWQMDVSTYIRARPFKMEGAGTTSLEGDGRPHVEGTTSE